MREKRMMKIIDSFFLSGEEGTTSIEYAIIASLLAVAVVVSVSSIGINLTGLFQSVIDNYPK